MGVIFDVDHDFEGPRAPKAHLDTVMNKPVIPPGPPPYNVQPLESHTSSALQDTWLS